MSQASHPTGNAPVAPLTSLYGRIEEIRLQTPELGEYLNAIADELPASSQQRKLRHLSSAVAKELSPATLVARFPKLRWLLTVSVETSTTDVLQMLLRRSSYENSLFQRRLNKTLYPVLLISLAVSVFLFLCIFVVPIFSGMYREFALKLPLPTRILVSSSDVIASNTILSIVVAAGFCGAVATVLWLWISDGPLRRWILGFDPKSAEVRFAMSDAALQIAELVGDQVPIEKALRITAESTPEKTLRIALMDLAMKAHSNPYRMQYSSAAVHLPPNFMHALTHDYESMGSVNVALLRTVAANYRDLSLNRRDWTSLLLGPITFLVIGSMILFVIVSLFSPFISLVSALSS